MERFVYANAFGFIVVFAEYVSLLRNESCGATWCMAIAILVFALNIMSLYEERAYAAKRTLNTLSLFGKDFNPPVDNKGYHYGL